MIALFAVMVSAAQESTAHEVTFVPALLIDERNVLLPRVLLPLPFQPAGQRGKRAADAVALVAATCTEHATGLLAQDV